MLNGSCLKRGEVTACSPAHTPTWELAANGGCDSEQPVRRQGSHGLRAEGKGHERPTRTGLCNDGRHKSLFSPPAPEHRAVRRARQTARFQFRTKGRIMRTTALHVQPIKQCPIFKRHAATVVQSNRKGFCYSSNSTSCQTGARTAHSEPEDASPPCSLGLTPGLLHADAGPLTICDMLQSDTQARSQHNAIGHKEPSVPAMQTIHAMSSTGCTLPESTPLISGMRPLLGSASRVRTRLLTAGVPLLICVGSCLFLRMPF